MFHRPSGQTKADSYQIFNYNKNFPYKILIGKMHFAKLIKFYLNKMYQKQFLSEFFPKYTHIKLSVSEMLILQVEYFERNELSIIFF